MSIWLHAERVFEARPWRLLGNRSVARLAAVVAWPSRRLTSANAAAADCCCAAVASEHSPLRGSSLHDSLHDTSISKTFLVAGRKVSGYAAGSVNGRQRKVKPFDHRDSMSS